MTWIREFENRLNRFEKRIAPRDGEIPISIKVRVDAGCYSRGCCPVAFRAIEEKLQELQKGECRFVCEEHESGPEIIAFVALTTAGLTLAKSVVDLVTAIIKARSEGRKHGDKHHEPVTLVVRRVEKPDLLAEERVLTFDTNDEVTSKIVREALLDGCKKVTKRQNQMRRDRTTKPPRPPSK